MKTFSLFTFSAIVLCSTILFSSCKKDNDPTASLEIEDQPLIRGNEDECPVALPSSLIDSIGTEHNRILPIGTMYYLENSDLVSLQTAVNYALFSEGYDTLTNAEWTSINDRFDFDVIEETIALSFDTLANSLQKQILKDMVDLIYDSTNQYEDIVIAITHLKEDAENLDCLEKYSTLVALEVCLNSAKLWLPIEAGGDGFFDTINDQYRNYKLRRSWWRAIAAVVVGDATGAFSGFVSAAMPSIATGGPANPISNAVLAGAAINGAVGGSVRAGVSYALLN